MLRGSLCQADDPWSASVGATTNYVYRGVSLSDNRGALQLGVNYQSQPGWFAGVWASNVDPFPGDTAFKELDGYAGYTRPLWDAFSVRGTYTHYGYLQNPPPLRYDHNEVAATLAYLDVLAATISYTPDSSSYSNLGVAQKRSTLAYEVTGRWPLGFGVALAAGGGYYDLHDLFGVSYWAGDVGLSYAYRDLSVDLTRFFVDATAARLYQEASANGTWVLTAVLRF